MSAGYFPAQTTAGRTGRRNIPTAAHPAHGSKVRGTTAALMAASRLEMVNGKWCADETHLFYSFGTDVSVLVSAGCVFLHRDRSDLDDRIPNRVHRALALYALAHGQMGLLATSLSGAVK